MKISLIIPIYNVEAYLDKCLKSVEEQSYKEAQVILVNDGSTDSSLKIAEKYASRNENFHLYTTPNGGQGAARNFGLEKAMGEYVVFLDSDDYLATNCLEKLLLAIEKEKSDMAVCACYNVTEDGKILSLWENNVKNETLSLEKEPTILFNRPSPWGKIFRRSLFDSLKFENGVWYEDMRLIPKIYAEANRITYIEDPLFFYVQREGSTMNNAKALRNLEIIDAFEDLISHYKEKGIYERYREEFGFLLIDHIAVAAMTRVISSGAAEKKEVLQKLEEYLSRFENLYENKYLALLGKNKKLILFFNRRRLFFLTRLCMKLKKKFK